MAVTFIKFKKYDNSACIRKPILPKSAVHAWAVKEEFAEKFMKLYNHCKPIVIDPEQSKIYGIDYNEMDAYVTGEIDEMPELEEFHEERHALYWDNRKRVNDNYQVVLIK